VAILSTWGLPLLRKKQRERLIIMKTVLPNYIDEKKPMLLRTTDQRLLAEILRTLERLVQALSQPQDAKETQKKRKQDAVK
jgi:hypothetical protein